MIEESARVVAIEGCTVWLETIRQSTCEACSSRSGCGQYVVSKLQPERMNLLKVTLDEGEDYPEGSMVRLGIPDGMVLKSAMIVYMLPLVGLIVGALLVAYLDILEWQDANAAMGGLLGLVLGLLGVRKHAHFAAGNSDYSPRILGFSQVACGTVEPLIFQLKD